MMAKRIVQGSQSRVGNYARLSVFRGVFRAKYDIRHALLFVILILSEYWCMRTRNGILWFALEIRTNWNHIHNALIFQSIRRRGARDRLSPAIFESKPSITVAAWFHAIRLWSRPSSLAPCNNVCNIITTQLTRCSSPRQHKPAQSESLCVADLEGHGPIGSYLMAVLLHSRRWSILNVILARIGPRYCSSWVRSPRPWAPERWFAGAAWRGFTAAAYIEARSAFHRWMFRSVVCVSAVVSRAA
jgi:hypothetical protein